MKYNIGDKVRVKSLEWYNKNKNKHGSVSCDADVTMVPAMAKLCNCIVTIERVHNYTYKIKESRYQWTDDMFEDLVFENIVFPNENYADKVELCLGDDYEIVVEDGRTFVQKKKPKYPKNYEECCKIMGFDHGNFITIRSLYYEDGEEIITDYEDTLKDKFGVLWELLICRNAYWKIAGEEMGLGKPWVPDWSVENEIKYVIEVYRSNVRKNSQGYFNTVLAFPTEEMRNIFFEYFKDLIEKCKELL